MKTFKTYPEFINENIDQETRVHFEKLTMDYVLGQGGIVNQENKTITVYHGSSKRNLRLIQRSGRLNSGTWFAVDEATAKRFGRQAGGPTDVQSFMIYAGSILPTGGYLSLNEDVLLDDDGIYKPKDMLSF